jgi:hypothetical protein
MLIENKIKMCDNCVYAPGCMFEAEFEICKQCWEERKALITQTEATKEYYVTKKDIENVRHIERKLTFYTKLYLVRDIQEIAYGKHGGAEGFLIYKNKRIDRLNKMRSKKSFDRNSRRTELNNHLKSLGLTIQIETNELCENYVEKGDKSGFTKDQIGKLFFDKEFRRKDLEKYLKSLNIATNDFGLVKNYIERNEPGGYTKEQIGKILLKRESRKIELNEHLKSLGLPGIRQDSQLCERYIRKGEKGGYTKEKIGDIMVEMNFLYTHTDYSNILTNDRQNRISNIRGYDDYYWDSDDEDHLREKTKRTALYKYVKEKCKSEEDINSNIPTILHENALRYFKSNT